MKRLAFRREAELEIDEAAAWYGSRSRQVGISFLRAIDDALLLIVEQPEAFVQVAYGTRRFQLRQFPYGLIYQPQGDTVLVISCFHGARDPKRWQERL